MEPAHPKGKDTALAQEQRFGPAVAGSASRIQSQGKHSDISRGK